MEQDFIGKFLQDFGSAVVDDEELEDFLKIVTVFVDIDRNDIDSRSQDITDIEISVLSPMRQIKSIDEFELHRHGIYIVKGHHSGTFLPQVADEVNWTKEEFLGHCSQDKAGLGWNGWRTAELYVYEAVVF